MGAANKYLHPAMRELVRLLAQVAVDAYLAEQEEQRNNKEKHDERKQQ